MITTTTSKPDLKFKGGGSFIALQPKFTQDGQTVFVAWNNILVSYSSKTGKRLREYRGLWSAIVGFEVTYIDGTEYLVACSATAEIISWKIELGFRLLKIEIPSLENKTVETFNLLRNNKFLVSYRDVSKVYFGVFSMGSRLLEPVNLKLERGSYKVGVGRGNRPFFGIVNNRQLFFVRVDDLGRIYRRHLDRKKRFTAIACHPTDDCLLTGDSLGRVLFWYDFDTPSVQPGVFHWHTLPVNCVTFSTSGTNFFSGGSENVLVKWHFDDNFKKFLPRMPAPIEHVTVSEDGSYVAVATEDNAVHVLDARFDTVSVIQHLVLGSYFPGGIAYDNRSKAMVLNGLTGHVQFYSPQDMTLLYNLDVVGHNKLTQERDENVENINVTLFALDDQGAWLATVEERKDASYTSELRLKFWHFNATKQRFEANTHVEQPHEKRISSLVFQPETSVARCVTVGEDARFKIWHCVSADTIYHKGNAWKCLYTIAYRDLPCNSCAFSSDGSVTGIGFGPILTVWDPETCKLKCSLVHPTHTNHLKRLHFGVANHCHLVVAATDEQISVWNLLTLAVVWTVPLQVNHLVASRMFSCMAVFTHSRKVFVFSPDSSDPLFSYDFVPEMGQIVAAAFIPGGCCSDSKANWFRAARLFFINSKEELFCFDTDEDNVDPFDLLSEDLSSGFYKSLMPAKPKKSSGNKQKPVHHLTKLSNKNKEIREMLGAPVHTMVPQRVTCESLLLSIVLEHNIVSC